MVDFPKDGHICCSFIKVTVATVFVSCDNNNYEVCIHTIEPLLEQLCSLLVDNHNLQMDCALLVEPPSHKNIEYVLVDNHNLQTVFAPLEKPFSFYSYPLQHTPLSLMLFAVDMHVNN